MVAEVEVEQSSSCHVRDVCAAEQNTLITAIVATLPSDSYMYVMFPHTCHCQWNQPPTADRPASLPPCMVSQASQNSYESPFSCYETRTMATHNALDMVLPLFACHVRAV